MHVLLFGTGVAFARLAGVMLLNHPQPIMVTLIGAAGMSTGQTSLPAWRSPVTSELIKSTPSSHEQLLEKENRFSSGSSLSQDSDSSSGSQGAQENERTGKTDGVEGGLTIDGQAGPVSSEQWTIIVSSIEKVKNYPRLAREHGIEGVVHVRFRLGPLGEVERVEIVRSSGFDVLDNASVRTIYRAAPLPYVKGWVEMPMKYVLK